MQSVYSVPVVNDAHAALMSECRGTRWGRSVRALFKSAYDEYAYRLSKLYANIGAPNYLSHSEV